MRDGGRRWERMRGRDGERQREEDTGEGVREGERKRERGEGEGGGKDERE